MTRDELKSHLEYDNEDESVYNKSDADSVMDDMEQRINHLEQIIRHKGCIEFVELAIINGNERIKNRMAFLLGFTPYEMSVEEFKKEHMINIEKMKARIKELEDELQVANRCADDARERIKELEKENMKLESAWLHATDVVKEQLEEIAELTDRIIELEKVDVCETDQLDLFESED